MKDRTDKELEVALNHARKLGCLVADPADKDLIEQWECWCAENGRPRVTVTMRPGDALATIELLMPIGAELDSAQQTFVMQGLTSASSAVMRPGQPRATSYGPYGGFSNLIPAEDAVDVAATLFRRVLRRKSPVRRIP